MGQTEFSIHPDNPKAIIIRPVKNSLLKSTVVGSGLGLADGLAFVIAFHSAADFLVPVLFWLALPCHWVALRFNWANAPEWLPWTAGVLTTALLGALLGLGIGWIRSRRGSA